MDIWLPPSEGKNAPSFGPSLDLGQLSFEALNSTRSAIIDACADITDPAQAQQVFNASSKHEAELAANRSLKEQPCAAASSIYTGVLFEAVLQQDASVWQSAAAEQISIFSGLFGVLKPSDLIPLHRLAMGANVPPLGKMSTLWRPLLDDKLEEEFSGHTILDCRSSDYKQACSAPWAHLWDVRVEREKNGKRSVVSHNAKKWRGLLTGALASHASTIDEPDALQEALYEITPELRTFDAEGRTSRVGAIEISQPQMTRTGGSKRTLTLVTVEA